jgi:hypothetical protein
MASASIGFVKAIPHLQVGDYHQLERVSARTGFIIDTLARTAWQEFYGSHGQKKACLATGTHTGVDDFY